MATKLRNSNLKVRITENIRINGVEHGATNIHSIAGVKSVMKRIISCPTTAETVLYNTHASTISGNTFDLTKVKYVRITNMDSSNFVDLIIENSAGDEIGYKLEPATSVIFWGHEGVLDAESGDVTIVPEVKAAGALNVNDGDENSNPPTEKDTIIMISNDGTSKTYVMVDDNATTVETGDVLASTSDTGASTAGSALVGGVAVALNLTGSVATQNAWLVQMKAAIEHANGHNGKIVVGAVPGEADGNQAVTLTQKSAGTDGNTTITEAITHANYTVTSFTGGTYGYVSNKVNILSINALPNTSDIDLELFVAST